MKLKDILIQKLLKENISEGNDFNHSIDAKMHEMFVEHGTPTSYKGELSPENTTEYMYHNFHTLHKNSDKDALRASVATYPHLRDEDKELLVNKSGIRTLERLRHHNIGDYKLFEKGIDSSSNLSDGIYDTYMSSHASHYINHLGYTLQESGAPQEEVDRIADRLVNKNSSDAHRGVLSNEILSTGLKDHHISKLLDSNNHGVVRLAASRPLSKENYDKAINTFLPETKGDEISGTRTPDEETRRLATVHNPQFNDVKKYFNLLDEKQNTEVRRAAMFSLDKKNLSHDDIDMGFTEHGDLVHKYILDRARLAKFRDEDSRDDNEIPLDQRDPDIKNYRALNENNIHSLIRGTADKKSKVGDDLVEKVVREPHVYSQMDSLSKESHVMAFDRGGDVKKYSLRTIPNHELNSWHFQDYKGNFDRETTRWVLNNRRDLGANTLKLHIYDQTNHPDIHASMFNQTLDSDSENSRNSLHKKILELYSHPFNKDKHEEHIEKVQGVALHHEALSPDNIRLIADNHNNSKWVLKGLVRHENTPSDVYDKIATHVGEMTNNDRNYDDAYHFISRPNASDEAKDNLIKSISSDYTKSELQKRFDRMKKLD